MLVTRIAKLYRSCKSLGSGGGMANPSCTKVVQRHPVLSIEQGTGRTIVGEVFKGLTVMLPPGLRIQCTLIDG